VRIGIFSRYSGNYGRGGLYHCSPCKIGKIVEELHKICEFESFINDYDLKYDFAIIDRTPLRRKISSKYTLKITECGFDMTGVDTACSISPYPAPKNNQFILMNYCHGDRDIKIATTDRVRMAYLGRLSPLAEAKIKTMNASGISFGVYPIKYWRGKSILRFTRSSPGFKENIEFVQSKIPGSLILEPKSHSKLYQELNRGHYFAGFVPSIYPLGSKKLQRESSSKFFEYIGAGMPVLIERNIPEAKIVMSNPFLGEVFSGKKDMISKGNKLNNNKYSYNKIAKYARDNHFPDSRAQTLFDNFLKDRA
jgi:hypothetical protein